MRASVSVVVPTLNEAAGVGALLESIHNQTYPITEFVVADGGSTMALATPSAATGW